MKKFNSDQPIIRYGFFFIGMIATTILGTISVATLIGLLFNK